MQEAKNYAFCITWAQASKRHEGATKGRTNAFKSQHLPILKQDDQG